MNNELVTCLLNGFIAPNRKVLLIFSFTPTLGPPYIYFFLDSHLRNVKISSARIFYKSFNCQHEFISSASCCMLFARKRKCPRFRWMAKVSRHWEFVRPIHPHGFSVACNHYLWSESISYVFIFAACRRVCSTPIVATTVAMPEL